MVKMDFAFDRNCSSLAVATTLITLLESHLAHRNVAHGLFLQAMKIAVFRKIM
jgi:hypothetical protein